MSAVRFIGIVACSLYQRSQCKAHYCQTDAFDLGESARCLRKCVDCAPSDPKQAGSGNEQKPSHSAKQRFQG